jgi:hypothetical protein
MAIGVGIVSTFDAKGVNKAIRDFKKLEGGVAKTGFAMQTSTSAINNGVKNLAKFGAVVGGIGAVIGGTLIKAALESQKVMKQTDAIITATGGAANLTTKQIGELARAMSVKTGVDDEAIQSSMNLLLTFKAVRNEVGAGNDIFARASMAALDLGNVFGSTDAAAKQLGKALSDPVKGVGALKKAGVDFTQAQRDQIKTLVESGDILSAQKLILKEVESQVGGTAAATATDFDRMKVAVGNVAEDLGTLLLPAFEATARFVTERLVPIFEQFSTIIGDQGLGAGFKYLGEQGLKAIGKLDGFGNIIYGVVAAVVALNVAQGVYAALTTLSTIATAAFGVTLNVALAGIPALVALILTVVVALLLRFKGLRDFMMPAFKAMADVFEFFVNRAISGINLLIRAYNAIPFLDNVSLIDKVNISLGETGKVAAASAADFRKMEESQKKYFKTVKPTGGGSGGGTKGPTAIEKAKTALDKYTSALTLFGSQTKAYNDAVKGVTTANMSLANATDDLRVAQDKFNKVSKGYGAGSKEAAVATRDLADANRSAVRATLSLRDATRNVADAQKTLNDLKSGKAVTAAETDLATATQKVADAQDAIVTARKSMRTSSITRAEALLETALDEQATAQEKVNDARALATPEAIRDAEENLTTAILDQEDAQIALSDAQQDVIDKQKELNEVVSGAATDSEKYKDAQKQLTDAQNAERDAVDAVTDAYDRQAEAARKLKKAKDDLAVAARSTTSKQEKAAQEATGIIAPSGGGGGGGFEFMGLPSIDFSNIDFSGIDFSGIMPFMADGGIVNKPTIAMIGESGSEAVIPLNRLNSGGDTYNITINSKIADNSLPDLLVAELRKFNRRSGAIDIQVT